MDQPVYVIKSVESVWTYKYNGKIYDVLKTGDIKKSRLQLSYIVGRDTENLSEKEMERIKEFSKDLIEISKAGLIEREYGEEEYLLIKKEIDWDKSLFLQAFCPSTKEKIKKLLWIDSSICAYDIFINENTNITYSSSWHSI